MDNLIWTSTGTQYLQSTHMEKNRFHTGHMLCKWPKLPPANTQTIPCTQTPSQRRMLAVKACCWIIKIFWLRPVFVKGSGTLKWFGAIFAAVYLGEEKFEDKGHNLSSAASHGAETRSFKAGLISRSVFPNP